MKNKNVVITGANAGLGYETARALAKMDANVIIIYIIKNYTVD